MRTWVVDLHLYHKGSHTGECGKSSDSGYSLMVGLREFPDGLDCVHWEQQLLGRSLDFIIISYQSKCMKGELFFWNERRADLEDE